MFLQSSRHTGEKNGTSQTDALLHAETVEAEFQRLKTGIHRELLDSLDLSRIAGLTEEELREDIRHLAEGMMRARSRKLPPIDEERLVDELIAESFGLGPLEIYMQDPDVTDILVNGPGEVYVERLGRLQETNTVFADEEHLLQIIQRIAARVGRRIDEHSPMVDARLADGSRVNAIIPPLALGGPVLSIRRFGHRPLQINDIMLRGSVCPEIMQVLEAAIEGRINLMISGGTGSGKTTMLNILSRYIPANERLVTIEDSAELNLQRKHVVKLETRPKNPEGAAEVSQRDLVRNALRMRPDRIILGEVRGGEALDMLQAMNTGHEGSMTTIHANDTRDALSRLEVMVSMSGFELPVSVTRRYIASAITVVVHLARLKGGVRRVMKVSEITSLDNNDYTVQDLFGFQQTGVDERGIARGHFFATGNKPNFLRRLNETGIELNERLFTARKLSADQAIGPMTVAEGTAALALQGNLA
ncbi:CpaF family protein [Anatilimnocola floriformis]|uniref:CpaF family protein n=1 Tax=Anatilimnocola floriformis TaxID=2948575 RepID=UPI0020C59590|nr:CpaF family protein [Anatilimnocola floriformis]